MFQSKGLIAFFALQSAAAMMGCGGGDDLPRRAISGAVKLDGQPLDGGRIEFQPIGPGVSTGSVIERGSYRIARAAGPTPGRYRVNISAPGEAGPSVEPEGSDPGPGRPGATERIPARYNASSTLTVEIKADGGDQFDFPLDSSRIPPAPSPPRVRK